MSGVETNRRARVGAWMALAAAAVAAGCGGGGGGVEPPPPPPAAASCTNDPGNFVGVCSGFNGDLDYAGPGDGGGGGDGGASGDGGTGAGGDFGQFRNVTITAYRNDGAGWVRVGSASTDDVKGMVTIRPGRGYAGPLMVELTGGANAQYFEEGKNTFVPFPAGRVIRTIVPRVNHNIGITPFTEAAYQLLTSGSADESVSGVPTAAQIAAANARVAALLNEHFPKALEVKAITKLPFIKSASVQQGALGLTDRGIYGVVNGAFSKQAALYNTASTTPTLDAVQQLAEDLRDGKLDGYNANRPAANAANRSYDPQTLTSELTAALAHQAERFGNQAIRDALPKLVNYGGTRYEGYLFDSSVTRNRGAVSTVAGWLAANTLNLNVGQANNKVLPPGQSAHSMIGNMGHGGAFFKIDSTDTVNGTPVYRTYALGDNVNGELGTGGTTSTARQLVEISLPGAMTHAAGGFAHTVFRLGDGRVFAVGDNTFGQLGQGSGSTAPARSTVPLEVPLPAFAGGAVAVAATSVASYALMADGSVYAWGSNGGFGLLGNGQASGTTASPTLVVGLSEIVQISARDNDVVALKRDQSIWQWGSHPADENGAYNDGDVTSPYRGGTLTPTQVNGLPTWQVNGRTVAVPVRKILTEQGLFGALLANGHVYTWGVHFDLSAKSILRDLTAARVFGAPPLRDVMPGGFVGYGARPFDRLTAMGVDYSGGMWKIRGRVAERFDPDNPTIQRRPQTGVPRSANCASCHTFLDETLEQLRVRQAAEAPVAPGAATCAPPPNVHVGTNGVSFIRAETECIQCHNPSRVDPRYAGQVAPAFAASGGWPNCNKPTNLPPRDNVPAAPITNSCSIPVGHVYTPPGTVCSSCHNSVAARALQDLNPPCAQPGSNELPTLATTAAIVSVTEDGGTAIAQGAYTRETTPQLNGTLSAALSGSQLLAVQRNGTPVGNALVSGTNFTFVDPAAPQGTAVYAVRVVQGSGFGATSNTWTVRVDSVAPSAVPAITALVDDTFGTVADGGFTTDSTPTLNGTLSAAPGTGEVLQVLRNGTAVGTATVTGTTWTYAEPSPLTAGSYTWAVRLADAAGNTGTGAQTSASLLGGVAGASIGTVVNNSSLPIAQGSITSDNTPDLRGTLTAALPAGHLLRVLRNGSPVGSLSAAQINGTSWAYTDPAPDGAVSYTVRVEAGAVVGAESAAYAFGIDSTAPSQPVNVTQIADSFIGNLADGATTADQTPTINGTLSAPLASGEQVRLRRTHTGTGAVVDQLFAFGGTTFAYTEPSLVADGTYRYEALVIDAAGNTGPTTGGTRSVRIDPTAVPLPGAAATITTINGAAPGGISNVNTPTLTGTLQRALNVGEVVIVFRNGAALPTPASVTGTNWSFTNGTLVDGLYTFTAQVQLATNSAVYGQMSANASVTIDATAPQQTISIGGIFDSNGISVGGNNTALATPRISGILSAGLGSGETLLLTRNNGSGPVNLTPTFTTATSWTYTESSALAAGATYTYTLRVRDAAGNLSASNPQLAVTVIAPLPTVNTIGVSGAVSGYVGTTSPLVVGSISAGLPTSPAGAVVRVFRGGVSIGTATVVNTTAWSITDSTTTTQAARTYTARVELGTAYSATSAGVAVTPDTTTGTTVSAVNITADAAPFNNTVGADADTLFNSGTTSDARPRIVVQLSGALSTGTTTSAESIQLTRNGAAFAFSATACPAGLSNAVCFTDNTQATTLTSTPTVLTTVPAPGTVTVPSTAGLPTGGVVYRARVVDAVSNQTALVATGTIVTDYVNCNQARATAANSGHITIATYTGSCLGCHKNYTGVNTNAPTPSGTIIPVPQTLPVYFCRKP
jgi:Bacterial Ig-like domain/Regulator of chromosome condensation (RCC1) repeat